MQSDSPYLTLKGRAECEIAAIKGSRFIAIAAPIADEQQVEVLLKSTQMRYPDARHHCWAYQLRQQSKTRFSDDGEPNGSAGKPILAPIVGRQLMDTMVLVVRYFGGVKLGVGGLVRAYSQAANAVLDTAEQQQLLVNIIPKVHLHLRYTYDLTNQVAAALATLDLLEESPHYSEWVESVVKVPQKDMAQVRLTLKDYTAGKIQLTSDTSEKS